MKNLFFSIATGMIVFGLASCKPNEYTCKCTNTVTGSVISESTIEADDFEEASRICDDRETFSLPDNCIIVD